ncbi:hypothetical protein EZS27_032070, partial [termite gut metagenome]
MRNYLFIMAIATLVLSSCNDVKEKVAGAEKFDYAVERFADLQILRYRVPGFEELSLKQKELIYYLTQAALEGRDILFDQNGKYNLIIRRTLEAIYSDFRGNRNDKDFAGMELYLKRVWFSSGIHHHYGNDKFVPTFTSEFLKQAILDIDASKLPLDEGQTAEELYEQIFPVIFDANVMPKRVNQADGEDLVVTSAANYYAGGVTQEEAEAFYNAKKNPNMETPISYGL